MTAQTKLTARQWPLSFFKQLGLSQIGTGNEVIVDIPVNAYLNSIAAFVKTAFDGSGTVTMTVTDGTNVLINAQTVKSTGVVTVAITKHFYPSGGTLTISIADQNSNSTVGAAYVEGSYLVDGRQTEYQR